MIESDQGRCPAGGRHRPPLLLVLAVALVAACSPLPEPSGAPVSPPPASPSTTPSQGTTPTTGGSPSPISAEDRLVVLARSDTGSHLVTWRDGARIEVSLPSPDAHGLAIDGTGRAAVVAGGQIFVADTLTRDEVRWRPIAEFRPEPGEIVFGLAWSPDGALAWAGAKNPSAWNFSVVAGPIGGTPRRTEVEATLDGPPVWLDAERVAVLAIRDPGHFLAIVRTRTSQVTLTPFEASNIAVSARLGLVAVGARDRAEVELRRLEGLTAAAPIKTIGSPEASSVGDLAFSTDGAFLAVTWYAADDARVSLYERSSGWQATTTLGLVDLGLRGPVTALELAWRP